MKKPVFTGSGVAVVTPFTDDFVDFTRFGEIIEKQIAAGTDAIIVCGTFVRQNGTAPCARRTQGI